MDEIQQLAQKARQRGEVGKADLLTLIDAIADACIVLTDKVIELEQRGTLSYRGVWSAGEPYQPGEAVTYNGSLWIAKVATVGVQPGDGVTFQLAAKRGRDGKDGRDGRDGKDARS